MSRSWCDYACPCVKLYSTIPPTPRESLGKCRATPPPECQLPPRSVSTSLSQTLPASPHAPWSPPISDFRHTHPCPEPPRPAFLHTHLPSLLAGPLPLRLGTHAPALRQLPLRTQPWTLVSQCLLPCSKGLAHPAQPWLRDSWSGAQESVSKPGKTEGISLGRGQTCWGRGAGYAAPVLESNSTANSSSHMVLPGQTRLDTQALNSVSSGSPAGSLSPLHRPPRTLQPGAGRPRAE